MKKFSLITIVFLLFFFEKAMGQCTPTEGSSSQNICLGGSVTTTKFHFSGASSASILPALPSGMSSNFNNGTDIFTISGSPDASQVETVYTITYTSGTCTFTLTVDEPPTVDAGLAMTICRGTTTGALGGTVDAGATSEWSSNDPAGTFNDNGTPDPTDDTYTATGTLPTVILTLTSIKGSCTVTDSRSITVDALPAVEAGSSMSVCRDATTGALGGTIDAGATGIWSSDDVAGSFNTNSTPDPTDDTYTATGTLPTVILTLTSTKGSCTVSDTRTLTVDAPPAVEAGLSLTICRGATTGPLGGTIDAGATGIWSSNDPAGSFNTNSTSDPTDDTYTATGTLSSVTLTLSSTKGSCTVADTRTLTVDAPPVVEAGLSLIICRDATTGPLGGTVDPAATSVWSSNDAAGSFNTNGTADPTDDSYTATGTLSSVTLTLTSTKGSCTVTDTRTLTVDAPPTANIDAVITPICQGGTTVPLNGSVTGSATGGTWSSSDGGTFVPDINTLNATWTPPAAYHGTASLTLTTTGGTCTAVTASKNVIVNPLPTINTTGTISAVCYNVGSDQTTGLEYLGTTENPTSYSINWSGIPNQSSTTFTSESGVGTIPGIIVPAGLSASGSPYSGIMSIVNGNACEVTQNVSLTVKGLPTPSITGVNDICVLSTQTYTTASGMSDYIWTFTGGGSFTDGGSADNSITINWPAVSPGKVSVNYKEAGCYAAAPTELNITIHPKPLPTDVAVHLDAGESLKQYVTIDASYNYIAGTCPPEDLTQSRISWYRADNDAGSNSTFITTKPGTDKTYTISAGDVGKYLQVRVEASDGTTLSSLATSSWVGTVAVNNVPTASNLSITGIPISGIPLVGNELTANFDYFDSEGDPAGSHLYKWYAGGSEISKATSSTYTIVKSDRDKVITFSVQPVAANGSTPGTIVTCSATPPVADQVPVVSTVSFSGNVRVGQTLTGSYVYSDFEGDIEDASFYQWYSGDASGVMTAIPGANSISFTLTNDQFTSTTNYIAFGVTPKTVVSSVVVSGAEGRSLRQGPVINPAPNATTSPITGNLIVGHILTGHYVYTDSEGDLEGASDYSWESSPNGLDSWSPAGTGLTHVITESEQGRYFRFLVTPRAQTGLKDGSLTPGFPYGPVNSKPIITGIGISGLANVGSELTGTYGFDDVDHDLLDHFIFGWLRDGIEIFGATSDKYTLTFDDEGHTITFRVIPIAQTGYLTGNPAFASTSTLIIDPNTEEPAANGICIEGSRALGEVLRAKYTYVHHRPELNSQYKWFRDDIEIADETSAQYRVQAVDIGAKITFKVRPRTSNVPQRGDIWFESQEFPKITGLESQYGLSASDVILSTNLGLPEGYFTGKGVTGTTFSPANAGEGDWEINYFRTYISGTNSCSQRAPQVVTVSADARTFLPAMASKYCSYDPPFTVEVSPAPVSPYNISVSCVDMDSNPDLDGVHLIGDYSITIEPANLREGRHKLVYYYSTDIYIPLLDRIFKFDFSVPKEFTIVKVRKDVKFTGLKDKYCKNADDQLITIEGVNPLAGTGTWEWVNVPGDGTVISETATASAKLMPKNAVAGSRSLKYQYSLEGCSSDQITESIDIYDSPDAEFNIDDYYNIDGPDVTLAPKIPGNSGGIFTGEGVSGYLLVPSLADEGPAVIKYTFTDVNLCTGTWTEPTTFRKAKGTITGISDVVCYDNINLTLTASGVPVDGEDGIVVYKGFSNTRGTLTPVINTTTVDYSLPAILDGEDVITFTYVWDGVEFSISKSVLIDNLGTVSIYNLAEDQDICDDVVPFKLTVSKPGGVFTGLVTGENFDPKAGSVEWVKYTYTNPKTGCSIFTTVNVNVFKAPEVDFIPLDVCINDEKDTLKFMNKTVSYDPVTKWKWEFDDEGTVTTDNVRESGYLYLKGGIQKIALTAETNNGCIVRKEKTFNIGRRPEADFYWKKDCYHPGESLQLIDASVYSTQPKSWSWDRNGAVFGTTNNAVYPKADTGFITIRYIVKTDYYMCHDTVIKSIYIRPTIRVPADGYFENFEAGRGGWSKGDVSSIWSFGPPNGTDIKAAASGQKAWYTANTQEGSASVESPCFDLSAMSRPLISLKMQTDFDKDRDGAAMQYKIGDEDNWHNVGTINDGIEWYNSATINGKPGGNSLGWTTVGSSDTEYKSAIHTLDELKGQQDVKFRMIYGSAGIYSSHDGIAFDDIFIGERSRNVLVEHFTSYGSSESMSYKDLVDNIAEHKKQDVINIQYHTNLSGVDSLYLFNPGEINARIMFYGLTRVPYTFVDGGNGTDKTFNVVYTYRGNNLIDSNTITKRTLVNSSFKLSIDPTVSGRVLSVKGYIKALEDINTDNLTLFIAVTEKKNKGDFQGVPESIDFINVFRKFIPDASGIMLKSSWNAGDSVAITEKVWTIDKVLNSSDIEVIAFLQNSETQEVYQAFSVIKPEILVGIENPSGSEARFSLFPNPAHNRFTVAFSGPLKTLAHIKIYNMQGSIVKEYRADQGSTQITVEDSGLKGGIYLVKVTYGTFDVGYKKLIISED
ncbi:MAG TPA: T9SS type A sorting domain-containing protein [Bacteroidales bacterium]|nr:T9SS type A sorting domain-containing protein [Bacteroidales bacterium]